MARHTSRTAARPIRPAALSAAGLALSGAVTASLLLSAPSRAGAALPPGAPASAVLVQLTNQKVDPLGMAAYTGTYGRAVSSAEGQSDSGDFSDPDGMLTRMTMATRTTRTDAQAAKYYAQAQLTGLVMQVNGKDMVRIAPASGTVGSLDSYAECVPPPVGPWALAYNRTDAELITVLGQKVGLGTTELTVTGADLGVATIGTSRLTVTVTQHQDPAAQSRQYTAEAWLDVTVDGVLNDLGGSQVYSGRITALRLGEVEVSCRAVTPTPSPTDSGSPTHSGSPTPSWSPTQSWSPTHSGSPTHSSSPTPSPSPSPSGSGSPAPTPSPTDSGSGSPTPTPSASVTVTPGPSRSPQPAPTATGGTLPGTGAGPAAWQAGLALGMVAVGAVAVVAARRRTGRH